MLVVHDSICHSVGRVGWVAWLHLQKSNRCWQRHIKKAWRRLECKGSMLAASISDEAASNRGRTFSIIMGGVMQIFARQVSKQNAKFDGIEEGPVGLLALNNGSQGTTACRRSHKGRRCCSAARSKCRPAGMAKCFGLLCSAGWFWKRSRTA